jgi:hypothetical protein
MPIQRSTSRRRFLKHSASAAIGVFGLASIHQRSAGAADVDRSISVKSPSEVRQTDVLFDPSQYTAFPHVLKLEGDELLMAFRQARYSSYTGKRLLKPRRLPNMPLLAATRVSSKSLSWLSLKTDMGITCRRT